MKNLIKFLIVLLAFQINAQTPLPSGARFPNATEKDLSEIKGFVTIDENNVSNGFVDGDTFYTKPEVDDKFTLSPESFNIIKSDTGLPIFTPTPGQWNEVIREIGNTIRDLNGDLIFIYSGHISPYNATNTPFLGALKSTDDGETWTDLGKITGQGFEDGYIIIHNGQYFIYSEKKIGAVSGGINLHYGADLMNLTDYGVAIPNGTVVGSWDELDRTSPTAFTEDGKIKMLFEGRSYGAGGNSGGAVGYAESNDGFNFTINPDPIIVGYFYANTLNPAPNALKLNWASHIVPDGLMKLDGNYYLTSHAYNGNQFALALTVSKQIESGWVDNIGTWIGLGEIESDKNGNGTSMFSVGSRLYANYEQNGSIYLGRFSVKVGSKGWYKTAVAGSVIYEITPNNRNEHIDFTNPNPSLIYPFADDDKSGVGIVKKLRNLTINPINIQPKAGVLVDGSNAQFSIPVGEIVEMVSTGVNQWVIFSRSQIIDEKFNPIAGANVTITGTYPNLTFNASGGGGGGLVLGETSTTAYRGDRGKTAYDYSQLGHVPLTQKGSVNGVATLDGSGKIPSTQYAITGADVGITSGGANMLARWSTNSNSWIPIGFNSLVSNSTVAQRDSSGRLKFADGSASEDGYTVGQATTALALKANDNAVVKLTGNQTIAGVKTFSSSPIVPTATLSTQAVNKGQLDSAISGNDLQQVLTNGNHATDNYIQLFSSTFNGYGEYNAAQMKVSGSNYTDEDWGGEIALYSNTNRIRNYSRNSVTSEDIFLDIDMDGFYFMNDNSSGNHTQGFTALKFTRPIGNAVHNVSIKNKGSNETVAFESDIIDILKALPTYNASTPQVLGHDASGNVQWQAP